MNYKIIKSTAGLLAIISLIFVFAGCGRDLGDLTEPDPENSNGANATIIVTMNEEMYSAFVSNYPGGFPTLTNTPDNNTVQNQVQPATVPQSTNAQQPSGAPAQTPSQNQNTGSNSGKTPLQYSKEELLTYFNTCVNKIKTAKPALTRDKNTAVSDIQLSNSMANSLVGFVKGILFSDDVDTQSVQKGQSCDNLVSREGKPYVSDLSMTDIKDITAVQEGSGYKVTVTMPDVHNTAADGPYSKIFQFLTTDDVQNVYAPKVGATVAKENIQMQYSGCTATATIDANGNVTAYETDVIGKMTLKDATIKKGVTIKTDMTVTLTTVTKYRDFIW